MTFWSSGFVFTKIVYKYTGPITTIFLRMLLSSSILLILFLCNKKRDKIERKDIKIFILMGFFEPFLYFIGEGYGLKYISTTYARITSYNVCYTKLLRDYILKVFYPDIFDELQR